MKAVIVLGLFIAAIWLIVDRFRRSFDLMRKNSDDLFILKRALGLLDLNDVDLDVAQLHTKLQKKGYEKARIRDKILGDWVGHEEINRFIVKHCSRSNMQTLKSYAKKLFKERKEKARAIAAWMSEKGKTPDEFYDAMMQKAEKETKDRFFLKGEMLERRADCLWKYAAARRIFEDKKKGQEEQ